MTHRDSQRTQDSRTRIWRGELQEVFFPRIARGHGQSIRKDRNGHKGGTGCQQACAAGRRLEASYSDKKGYVDGHYQTQDVALRAHQEGYR
jgi:hypothetical protein